MSTDTQFLGKQLIDKPIQLASLWIGDELSPLEQASALSFLELGHELTLYVTSPVKGVPPGVRIRDASEVLRTSRIVLHKKTGSPALHSDLFRFALMRTTEATWVDLDIICLQALSFSSDYVFGLETADLAAGGILRLPKSSAALADLSKYNEDSVGYPAHLSSWRKRKYFLKSFGRGLHISEWPWGSIGPIGLTFYLHLHGELHNAMPIEAFYPIPLERTLLFTQPGRLSRSSFGANTFAVHLWGKELRRIIKNSPDQRIDPESFLGLEIARQSAWSGFPIKMEFL